MPHNDNLLLASLSPGDLAALQPHLKLAHFEQEQVLYEAGDTIDATYFPTSAVISIVVTLSSGQVVEAAMVGRDGVIGASAALDGKTALSRAVIQLSGEAMVCSSAGLRGAAMQSQPLLSLLIRHEQTLYAQAQQSTACMAAHHVDARLCRWLLRSRDLSQSDTLLFTQEFLAEMLGVNRTSVTVVAHTLQQAGIIQYTRGKIRITNLVGLQDAACECYEAVKSQYQGLLGEPKHQSL
ncbi:MULTISPECIES: Crp/Fnr family transcriptional regulator [Bradyrhizobium]|uniref:Cyclic nucleotide-binding protein n=1 Tax=Bradyrhizobium valentinum TaxID=1518501 RepID=A0A0R3LFK9_9BRAD|nr:MULTISPECIES: Crp/Fnr family transcriptional regulator [Bradyrhizobium]KRR06580.1 cyclic nucleotide-binding protein [Bradyrhizobium valentinum]MDE5454178.1 helix-turn-helix domain-containing protein [Bradyrhizobium sp. CSA112]